MKLYITNKLVSVGGSSTVVDDNQKTFFNVKGKIFSPTKKKFIYDAENNLHYIIRNKWFNFFNTSSYIYDANKNLVAKITDKFGDFKKIYYIDGGDDVYVIKGEWLSFNMEILKNDQLIGTIKREFKFFVDSFVLEANEENMPFLVALVIAIDNIQDNQSKKRD